MDIDRTAIFLKYIDKTKTIKDGESFIYVKKEMENPFYGVIVIETDFKTFYVFPFIDGKTGFVVKYFDESFYMALNIPVVNKEDFINVTEEFYKTIIFEIIRNVKI